MLALLACGALIAAGCGGSSDNGSSSASPGTTAAPAPSVETTAGGGSSETTKATIKDFAFHPDRLQVKVGQKVTWTNDDSTSHTVTADDGSFDSKAISQGKSFSFTFDKKGTFAYHCSFHSNMTAEVVVT